MLALVEKTSGGEAREQTRKVGENISGDQSAPTAPAGAVAAVGWGTYAPDASQETVRRPHRRSPSFSSSSSRPPRVLGHPQTFSSRVLALETHCRPYTPLWTSSPSLPSAARATAAARKSLLPFSSWFSLVRPGPPILMPSSSFSPGSSAEAPLFPPSAVPI